MVVADRFFFKAYGAHNVRWCQWGDGTSRTAMSSGLAAAFIMVWPVAVGRSSGLGSKMSPPRGELSVSEN